MLNRTQTGYYFRKGYDPRDEQVELMEWWDSVRGNGVKCKKAAAPTGTGKSLGIDAITKREEESGKKVSIVTGTIILQEQYRREFSEYPVLMGASNYDCVCFPGNTCDLTRQMDQLMGLKAGESCGDHCPYSRARSDCYEQSSAIFNTMSYHYFPKWSGGNDQISKVPVTDLLIVDEFQMVAGMLNSMFELVIWEDEIDIPFGTSASVLATHALLKKRQSALSAYVKENITKLAPKKLKGLVGALNKIDEVARWLRDDSELFVIEEVNKLRYGKSLRCLQLRVIRPMPRVLNHFFAAKEVLLMSATALDIDVRELGFKKFDSIEVGSPIPVDQRLFYAENTVKYSFKTEAFATPLLIKRIKEICENIHPNERGIILTTYRFAEVLRQHLTDSRFVFHTQADKKAVVGEFVGGAGVNTVAILSGSWEGLDLKDDLARFVIIPIFPLPNWKDSVVQKRVLLDQALETPEHWYEMQAMKSVIQGSGRASRNERDKSTIYMLDSKFTGAFLKVKKQLPKAFIEAIRWSKR